MSSEGCDCYREARGVLGQTKTRLGDFVDTTQGAEDRKLTIGRFGVGAILERSLCVLGYFGVELHRYYTPLEVFFAMTFPHSSTRCSQGMILSMACQRRMKRHAASVAEAPSACGNASTLGRPQGLFGDLPSSPLRQAPSSALLKTKRSFGRPPWWSRPCCCWEPWSRLLSPAGTGSDRTETASPRRSLRCGAKEPICTVRL